MAIGQLVAADPRLLHHLLARHELPLKALEDLVSVSRKTLERQRRDIIAVALATSSEFPHLKGYLHKG
jgi:RNA polymerase sigma factor